MDDKQIQQIIESLEEGAGTAEGKSRLSWPDDLAWLTANKTGLLQLACALLRAATRPIPPGDCRSTPVWVDTKLDQVVDDGEYDMILGPIDRMETWPEPKGTGHKSPWRDRILLWGCGLVAAILTSFFAIGVFNVWRFFFGTK